MKAANYCLPSSPYAVFSPGAYHSNLVNQVIHIICVPAIFTTALVFLSYWNLEKSLPTGVAEAILPYTGSVPLAPLLVTTLYALYYLYLTPFSLGFLASSICFAELFLCIKFIAYFGAAAWKPALVIHVLGWIAQFYGHGVHEKRAPALIDNLVQALFMAPLFVLMETLMFMGFLGDFKALIEPVIAKHVSTFRDGKNKSSKKN